MAKHSKDKLIITAADELTFKDVKKQFDEYAPVGSKKAGFLVAPDGAVGYFREVDRRAELAKDMKNYTEALANYELEVKYYDEVTYRNYLKEVSDYENITIQKYRAEREAFEKAVPYSMRYENNPDGTLKYPAPEYPKAPTRPPRPMYPEEPLFSSKWRSVVLYFSFVQKSLVYLKDKPHATGPFVHDADTASDAGDGSKRGDYYRDNKQHNISISLLNGWKLPSARNIVTMLETNVFDVVNSKLNESEDIVDEDSNESSSLYVPAKAIWEWVNLNIPEDERPKFYGTTPVREMPSQNDPKNIPFWAYAVCPTLKEYIDGVCKTIVAMWEDPSQFSMWERFTKGRLAGNRSSYFMMAQEKAKDYGPLNKEVNAHRHHMMSSSPEDCPDIPNLRKGVEFYAHQAMTISLLDKTPVAAIDASMGAGKTLALIADVINQLAKGRCKRPLIVMPNSTLSQQKAETEYFTAGKLNVVVINSDTFRDAGSTEEERYDFFVDFADNAPPNTVYFTSYDFAKIGSRVFTGEVRQMRKKTPSGETLYQRVEAFVPDRAQWFIDSLKIDYVALDESHKIKNKQSVVSQAIMTLSEAPIRRAASGTIIPNTPADLVSQYAFLDPMVFGAKKDFIDSYALMTNGYGKVRMWKKGALKQIRKKIIENGGVTIRRSNWLKSLPERVEQIHVCNFSKTQHLEYKRLLDDAIEDIKSDPKYIAAMAKMEEDDEDQTEWGPILAKLAKVDAFILAPNGVDGKGNPLSSLVQKLPPEEQISPKIPVINKILEDHFAMEDPGKVLVFVKNKASAHHIIDNLHPKFKHMAVYYCKTDNSTVARNINRFKEEDEIKILVGVDMSLKEGHNLQMANRVIRCDIHWNPGDMEQGYGRIWRPKQHRKCYIDIILVNESIDITKYGRCVSKLQVQRKVESDYDDDEDLPIVQMSIDNIMTWDKEHMLKPYAKRTAQLDAYEKDEANRLYAIHGGALHNKRLAGVIEGSTTIRTPTLMRTGILPPVYTIYCKELEVAGVKCLAVSDEDSLSLFQSGDASSMGFKFTKKVKPDGAWYIAMPKNIAKFTDTALNEYGYHFVWEQKRVIPKTVPVDERDPSFFKLFDYTRLPSGVREFSFDLASVEGVSDSSNHLYCVAEEGEFDSGDEASIKTKAKSLGHYVYTGSVALQENEHEFPNGRFIITCNPIVALTSLVKVKKAFENELLQGMNYDMVKMQTAKTWTRVDEEAESTAPEEQKPTPQAILPVTPKAPKPVGVVEVKTEEPKRDKTGLPPLSSPSGTIEPACLYLVFRSASGMSEKNKTATVGKFVALLKGMTYPIKDDLIKTFKNIPKIASLIEAKSITSSGFYWSSSMDAWILEFDDSLEKLRVAKIVESRFRKTLSASEFAGLTLRVVYCLDKETMPILPATPKAFKVFSPSEETIALVRSILGNGLILTHNPAASIDVICSTIATRAHVMAVQSQPEYLNGKYGPVAMVKVQGITDAINAMLADETLSKVQDTPAEVMQSLPVIAPEPESGSFGRSKVPQVDDTPIPVVNKPVAVPKQVLTDIEIIPKKPKDTGKDKPQEVFEVKPKKVPTDAVPTSVVINKRRLDEKADLRSISMFMETRNEMAFLVVDDDDSGDGIKTVKQYGKFVHRPGIAYFVVETKAQALRMLERTKTKARLQISNEEDVVEEILRTKMLIPSSEKDDTPKVLVQQPQSDDSIEMEFGTYNGSKCLMVWVTEAKSEIAALKRIGFVVTAPFYEMQIGTSWAKVSNFLRYLRSTGDIQLSNWSDFSTELSEVYPDNTFETDYDSLNPNSVRTARTKKVRVEKPVLGSKRRTH